ncbi:aminotransferase class III-fold pyridoxal phosphate-dependent enzyme [Sporolactobacillus sp. CQH2019]|nr:aminotransferase class III-fold pyridoxal phosphate-dependent enzyme [Sporolactobacillus sp. CQH2019]MDD9148947.1 aminotransferase class III-fold pyridoxal phosphate-dependent enzyme [Sporolactobacillus sp. CQH2019]
MDGNRFIDSAGMIGVQNVGHYHPEVIEATKKQPESDLHPGFNVIMYPSYIERCENF